MSSQFSDSREYQIKLLAYMLNNHDFCTIAGDVLKDEHFSDKALQWFFETLRDAKVKLTSASLQQEMVKAVQAKTIREDEIDKYLEYFNFLKVKPLPVEEEHINNELGTFIRTQATKLALQDSWNLAKNEQWEEIVTKLQDAVNQGLDVLTLGNFYFQDYQQRLSDRLNAVKVERLPTGIPDLDDLMYGGLRLKQLGLVAGGTGRGKSIFLAWLAQVSILLGKKVVYYTMELSTEDVAERFDSLFTKVKINDLKTYNNAVFSSLSTMSSKFSDHLVIKEYPPDTATVGTLKAHLRQLAGVGFIPDLVIVDYLDLVKPHRTYNSSHEELDAITKALRGLAVEYATRVWTATQLNRAGMAMETPDETAIAGAVSKLFTVDFALLMAQTQEEREDELIRLLIAKSRIGPAGRTIKLDTDYSRMAFYRPPPIPAATTVVPPPTPVKKDNDTDVLGQVDGVTEEDGKLVLE